MGWLSGLLGGGIVEPITAIGSVLDNLITSFGLVKKLSSIIVGKTLFIINIYSHPSFLITTTRAAM